MSCEKCFRPLGFIRHGYNGMVICSKCHDELQSYRKKQEMEETLRKMKMIQEVMNSHRSPRASPRQEDELGSRAFRTATWLIKEMDKIPVRVFEELPNGSLKELRRI